MSAPFQEKVFVVCTYLITVRDRIPVGMTFSFRQDRPWGSPSLLYNGHRVFPRGIGRRVVVLTPTPT